MNPVLKQHLTEIYDWGRLRYARLNSRYIWHKISRKMLKNGVTTKTAHLATINYCNAKCNFCGQHKFKRPAGVMSLEDFRNILADLVCLGYKEIDFTPPLGDPLLDESILEKALTAKQYGLCTSITTNGIKLNGQIYRKFVDSFDNIRISLGGCSRDEYHKIYGVDKFDNVVTWILEMLRYNDCFDRRANFLIFLRASSKWSEIKRSMLYERLRPYIKNKTLKLEYTNLYDNWGGSIKPSDMLGEMKMRSAKKKSGVPCIALKQFFIEYNGNVRLCGCRFKDKEDDDLVIGNTKTRFLNEILDSSNVKIVYEKFRDGNKLPDVCENCSLYRPMI
jgi:radical SAM protein with 4Fe4S-binding SPASM domain